MPKDKVNIHNGPNRDYELIEYDPVWETRFEEITSRIEPVFGDNLIKIEHVGSTSVPNMIAKPTIDISVVVKDLRLVSATYKEMKELGFQALGNFIQQAEPEEYFILNGDSQGNRLVNIHVMQLGNSEVEDMITLRDFLRSNPSARNDYVKHKKLLMEEHGGGDYNSYSQHKRAFLEDLKAEARKWRVRGS